MSAERIISSGTGSSQTRVIVPMAPPAAPVPELEDEVVLIELGDGEAIVAAIWPHAGVVRETAFDFEEERPLP